jgi:molybdopterin synthase sulfur carrier subunit
MKILLFGIAKDICGGREIEVDFPENGTVGELDFLLKNKFPELKNLRSVVFAVNETYADFEQKLQKTDEIALIPPVSGG